MKKEIHTDMALGSNMPDKDVPNPRPVPMMEKMEGNARTNTIALQDLLNAPTVTTATRLAPNMARLVDTKSVASVSEYNPSNYDPGSEAYAFPPAPVLKDNEKYFECPYCFTTCPSKMLSDRAWKSVCIPLILITLTDPQQSSPYSRSSALCMHISGVQKWHADLRQSSRLDVTREFGTS